MKLTPEQDAIKKRIEGKKRQYDAELAIIEAAYVNAKEAAKQPLRDLVAEAEAARIPQRQIHLAFGFAQLSSLVSFLLPSKRVGGSLLYTGANVANPIAAAQAKVAARKLEIRQEGINAYWTNADGEERHIERMVHPAGMYLIFEGGWASLTDEEKAAFLADGPTLAGDAEYDAYMDEGIKPEHWAQHQK